jgi:hypothetical protein
MRSSPGTLQNHYLKKDVDLMQDKEPEPQQQQKILTEIDKNVVDETLIKKEVEQPLIKQVEKTKNKKLSDEEHQIKHENKKQYLREYYD